MAFKALMNWAASIVEIFNWPKRKFVLIQTDSRYSSLANDEFNQNLS